MDIDLWMLLVLPLGLGLLGFIEPCSIGSTLLFVKYLEEKNAASKVVETVVFALTRGVFIGALGALAAFIGSAFVDLQRLFWVSLGSVYLVLGGLYLFGQQRRLTGLLGPIFRRNLGMRGAVTLGVVFGLNIPACAAPLLAAIFAASFGAATVAQGFWMMAIFGVALSLPLIAAVSWTRARAALTRVAGITERAPFWIGVVLVVLGAWSIYLGLDAS